jgi:riboflavin kinase/FMN adenylyltransferase
MAAISVGHQPTFGGTDLAVEAYLLDFEGDLYGQELEVEFAARLHPDTRYPSVEALIEQIGQDVAETRRLLSDDFR